jgi:hypothetical protein
MFLEFCLISPQHVDQGVTVLLRGSSSIADAMHMCVGSGTLLPRLAGDGLYARMLIMTTPCLYLGE